MATGRIKTLYSDKEKTEALFPRTKTSAVSDADGVGLDAIVDGVIYSDTNGVDSTVETINAHTLGGYSVAGVINLIYPVGSIYMSVNSASPATLFGGTWEQLENRFLLGAGSTYAAGSSGGEAEHTLTEDELPEISGSFQTRKWHTTNMFNTLQGVFSSENISSDAYGAANSGTAAGYQKLEMSFGGGTAHNNMPPYLAVYMWKRTA